VIYAKPNDLKIPGSAQHIAQGDRRPSKSHSRLLREAFAIFSTICRLV